MIVRSVSLEKWHWAWLDAQGNASRAVRRLVEAAMAELDPGEERIRSIVERVLAGAAWPTASVAQAPEAAPDVTERVRLEVARLLEG